MALNVTESSELEVKINSTNFESHINDNYRAHSPPILIYFIDYIYVCNEVYIIKFLIARRCTNEIYQVTM